MEDYLTLDQLIQRLTKLSEENGPSTPTNVRDVKRDLYPVTHVDVDAENQELMDRITHLEWRLAHCEY